MALASKLLVLCCLIGYGLAQYCQSGPTTTVDGNLGKVTLRGDSRTMTDDSDCPGYIGPKDLTNLWVDLHPGGTYDLQLNVTSCGNPFPTVSGAWIDYDHNDKFDTYEALFPFNRSAGWLTIKWKVNITTPVITGLTRMRVQVQETSSTQPLDPCQRFAYGGTKDFNVSIGQGGGGGGGSSSSSGMSGGSVFIIIVVVVSAFYVIVGCAYNRVKKGTTGMRESCPQNEFWCDLPGLMKDGFLFTKAKVTGKGGGGDGYDKIDDNL